MLSKGKLTLDENVKLAQPPEPAPVKAVKKKKYQGKSGQGKPFQYRGKKN